MKTFTWRLLTAAALVAVGWTLGHAQVTQPDFEIYVTTSGSGTKIECLRGCNLAWVERGLNPAARPSQTFSFQCSSQECRSGKVGGWTSR
jgi:hypothetical protein